jgi:hypothetical protein
MTLVKDVGQKQKAEKRGKDGKELCLETVDRDELGQRYRPRTRVRVISRKLRAT